MSDAAIARLQNDVSDLRVAQAATDAIVAGGRDVVMDVKGTVEQHGQDISELKEKDAGMAADLRAVASRPTWAMVAKENPKLTAVVFVAVALCWLLGDAVIGTVSLDALEGKVDVVTAAGAAEPGARRTPGVVPAEGGGGDSVRDVDSDIPMAGSPRPIP